MSQALRDFLKSMGQAFDFGTILALDKGSNERQSHGQLINGYWRNVGQYMNSAMKKSTSYGASKASTRSDKK